MSENFLKQIDVDFCILCDVPVRENNSKEHIIPQAIGGRLKAKNIICKSCNENEASEWDAVLVKSLEFLSGLLQIKRERGEIPSRKIAVTPMLPELGGEERFWLNADKSLSPIRPECKILEEAGKKYIVATGKDKESVKKALKGELRNRNLIYNSKTVKFRNVDEKINNIHVEKSSIGDVDSNRSTVKTALVYAISIGVKSNFCTIVLEYLKNDKANSCIGFYHENDLIKNRPKNHVFHCVSVQNKNGLLLGYVEYFSAFRFIICLSEAYSGPDVYGCYAINPVSGEQFNLEVDMAFLLEDIRDIYQCKKAPSSEKMSEALDFVLKLGLGV